MGKIIKFKFSNPIEEQKKENINQLKKLIEWHLPENKKFVINKIKKEQNF